MKTRRYKQNGEREGEPARCYETQRSEYDKERADFAKGVYKT